MKKTNDNAIKKVLFLLNKKERIQIFFLFFFILLGVVLETIGVGVVIPFISIISDPLTASNNRYIEMFIRFFQIESHQMLIISACIGVVSILCMKNIMLYLIFHAQTKFTSRKQANLSAQLFGTYLKRPYIFFSEKNSAEFQRNINSSVPEVVNGIIFPAMLLVSECLIAIAIFLLLLWTDWFSSLAVLAVLGVTAGIYHTWSGKRLAEYTHMRNALSTSLIKWVNQAFGGIKEIKVLGREQYFYDNFFKSAECYVDISRRYQLVTFIPRLYFESVTIIALVVIVLMILLREGDSRSLMPILGLFAMAAFRILPAINRITTLNNSIQYYFAQLDNVYEELNDKNVEKTINNECERICNSQLVFNKKISIEGLSFHYPNMPMIIQGFNLDILKGEMIGFIGVSGAGKSTLIDLVLGLLKPTNGYIKVDDVDIQACLEGWHKLIGYIPQKIYLNDDTILRNVALGIKDEEINEAQVWNALEIAQLKGDIENFPEKLNAGIGEDGARLSGGQRQRIGIARALYHNPEILILDEATASLDMETEREFSAAIENLSGKKTLLIIAHRIATLEKCDSVYEVKDGKVTRIEKNSMKDR